MRALIKDSTPLLALLLFCCLCFGVGISNGPYSKYCILSGVFLFGVFNIVLAIEKHSINVIDAIKEEQNQRQINTKMEEE